MTSSVLANQALLAKNFVIFWLPEVSFLPGLLGLLLVALIFGLLPLSGGSWACFFKGGSLFVGGYDACLFSPLLFVASCEVGSAVGLSGLTFSAPPAFWVALAKKLAMLDLFSLLATGIMKEGELVPTFPTSLVTG